jgi:hypothetical protein
MRGAAVLLTLLAVLPALADQPPELRPGSRVRVATSGGGGTIRGRVATLDERFLTVEPKPGTNPIIVDRSQITRLELSAGRRSRGRGALIGAAVGLGVGLLFTAGVAESESCNGQNDCGLGTALSLIFLTPALTVTGALVGVALPPPERWVTMPVTPRARPSGASNLGLRFSVRF